MNYFGNIPKLYAFAFLKMALFPMAIITLYWKDHIGLNLTDIMVLQGVFSIATLLMEYPSGVLADRYGYRWSLNLAALLGVTGWGWYCLADSFVTVLGAELLLGGSYAFASGSESALLFESLKLHGREEEYAFRDGRMTGWAQIGEACGALFAGVLYAFSPLVPFYIQVFVWLLALLICRTLREVPADTDLASGSWQRGREALKLAMHGAPQLRRTLVLGAVLGIASFYPVWLIQPHMQQQGVPLAWFGPVWAGANATVAIFSLLSHRAEFQFGLKGLCWLCFGLCTLGYLGLGLVVGPWSFLFYYLLTAMRGLQGPALRNQLQQASPRSYRASVLSLKSLLFRLLFVATGPLVGWGADHFGLSPIFLLLMVVLSGTLLPLTLQFLGGHKTSIPP